MFVKTTLLTAFIIICSYGNKVCLATDKPHIVFILADDLGWNDVGFHGSGQIPTPNIDALAYSGIILNNYYVTPICTPSRSTLMTGKYPIHTGMQHTVLYGAEARGLPLSEKILPEYLRELGYVNRIVGKWHLGSYKKEFTPTHRGFLSHLGYWTGHQDYFDHTAVENPGWGFDMRRNMELAKDLHGQYSTDVFTKEAVRLVGEHNDTKPLFLYLAHAAVHSGNPYNPLPAPDDTVLKFDKRIESYKRRRFAAMLSKLDDSVGAVVNALKQRNMLEKSVIIFSTDNGGPANGFNLNYASNFPLKGVKNTLWEGGVRGAGLMWSPLITKSSRVAKQFMHISDWLPTLLHIAGGDQSVLKKIDGMDMWPALNKDFESNRTEILHNIDDIYGNAALTVGPWKLVKGTTYNGTWDDWYGPSGRNDAYDLDSIFNCEAGQALELKQKFTPVQLLELRETAQIVCTTEKLAKVVCEPLQKPCLFNIVRDPCEEVNLADKYPEILLRLEESLAKYNASAIPPGNLPLDTRGNPKYWNYTWTNFGDYI